MSFIKSTTGKRKFWVCITSFFTIAILSIGISSCFIPQGKLAGDIDDNNKHFEYIWNSVDEERPDENAGAVIDLFFSYDIENNELKDDDLNLKYLFEKNELTRNSYIKARKKYINYNENEKRLFDSKITMLNVIDYGKLTNKFGSHVIAFKDSANEWFVVQQFMYIPSGGPLNSVFIILSFLLPFPIYNFYFYSRFSAFEIWLQELWVKMTPNKNVNKKKHDDDKAIFLEKFSPENTEKLNTTENLCFRIWIKLYIYLGIPFILFGITFSLSAFFFYSLSRLFTIIGISFLILPLLSYFIFLANYGCECKKWGYNRQDITKPFHGRFLKEDDYDTTSESIKRKHEEIACKTPNKKLGW